LSRLVNPLLRCGGNLITLNFATSELFLTFAHSFARQRLLRSPTAFEFLSPFAVTPVRLVENLGSTPVTVSFSSNKVEPSVTCPVAVNARTCRRMQRPAPMAPPFFHGFPTSQNGSF
jgi:hypothetical protein